MFEVLFYVLFRLTLETRDVRSDVRPDVRPDVRAAPVVRGEKKTRGVRGAAAPRLNPSRGGSGGAKPPQPKFGGSGGQRPPAKIFPKNRKIEAVFDLKIPRKKYCFNDTLLNKLMEPRSTFLRKYISLRLHPGRIRNIFGRFQSIS